MMTIGERVKQLRMERGMSHTALARTMGRGRAHIYQVESDESSPTLVWLEQAAEALGVTVTELLEPLYSEAGDPTRRLKREMSYLAVALENARRALSGSWELEEYMRWLEARGR